MTLLLIKIPHKRISFEINTVFPCKWFSIPWASKPE